MVKIALIFSGQYRDIPQEIFRESLNKFIEGYDYGIFSFSWKEKGISLNHKSKIPLAEKDLDSKIIIENLFSEFNLVKNESVSFKDFPKLISKKHNSILNSKEHKIGTIHSLPQIYAIHRSYKLLQPFLNEYDFIFRCRYDSIFIHPISFYEIEKYKDKNYIYTLNFGRAYYPKRIYDVFFGGSKKSMGFLQNIWSFLPNDIESTFNNGLDKRDACRLLYIAAKRENKLIRTFNSRVCDVYREFDSKQYISYLISSHLFSSRININSYRTFKSALIWSQKRNIPLFIIFIQFLKVIIISPLMIIKRVKFLRYFKFKNF